MAKRKKLAWQWFKHRFVDNNVPLLLTIAIILFISASIFTLVLFNSGTRDFFIDLGYTSIKQLYVYMMLITVSMITLFFLKKSLLEWQWLKGQFGHYLYPIIRIIHITLFIILIFSVVFFFIIDNSNMKDWFIEQGYTDETINQLYVYMMLIIVGTSILISSRNTLLKWWQQLIKRFSSNNVCLITFILSILVIYFVVLYFIICNSDHRIIACLGYTKETINKLYEHLTLIAAGLTTLVFQYFRVKVRDRQVSNLSDDIKLKTKTQQDEQFKKAIELLSNSDSNFDSKAGAVYLLGSLGCETNTHAQSCLDMLAELNRWMGQRLNADPSYFDRKKGWYSRVVISDSQSLAEHYALINRQNKNDKEQQVISLNKKQQLAEQYLQSEDLSRLALIKIADIIKAHAHDDATSNKKLSKFNLRGKFLCQLDLRGLHLGDRIDFTNTRLQGANLEKTQLQETNLEKANLEDAYLQGANLQKANLEDAYLQGANLQKANLRDAHLQGAIFNNTTNLKGINLQGANLQKANLRDTQLQGANLRDAQLQGADLQKAYLYKAHLQGANLGDTQLQGAILEKANLQKAQLQSTNLQKAQLRNAKLEKANLQWATLLFSQLQGANLRDAHLLGANLRDAQLQGADLSFAQLQWARMEKAQLQGADLSFAHLQKANLGGTHLQGVNLGGTQLQATNLYDAHLQGADFNDTDMRGIFLDAQKFIGMLAPRSVIDKLDEKQTGKLTNGAIDTIIKDLKNKNVDDTIIKKVEETLQSRSNTALNLDGIIYGTLTQEECDTIKNKYDKAMGGRVSKNNFLSQLFNLIRNR